ncbi:MAG TPA: hypothetical protein VK157_17090 [Phycisphaerales bacterium]|nr:hypothetical protein [Phycisphaerales bacterium]
MSTPEWYCQPHWTAEAESEFWRRWNRARPWNRAQYLRIQAHYLSRSNTQSDNVVAVELIDRLLRDFADARLEIAPAHMTRGDALLALGDIDAAIECYFAADAQEHAFPNVLVHGALNALYTVAIHAKHDQYARALRTYEQRVQSPDGDFAIDSFRLQTALSFILADTGAPSDAAECAKLALQYAEKEHSGFTQHPTVGLVVHVPPAIHAKLRSIAANDVSGLIGWIKQKASGSHHRPPGV